MKFTLEHALILILAISVIYSVIQYSTSRVSFNTKVVKAKHSTTENPCSILNSPLIGQDCTVTISDGRQNYNIITRCPNNDGSLICFGQSIYGDRGSCQVNPYLDTHKCKYNSSDKTWYPSDQK